MNAGQQVGPRGGGRFVQREREPAVGRRAQALDQFGHARRCENHFSSRSVSGTLVMRPSVVDALTVIENDRLSKKNGMPDGI